MWLQHQYKRQLRLEKADSKRNVTLIVSWQNPIDWLRHAGAKPREEVDYSAARQDTSSDRDCRFDQKEESSMIGRDLFNIPCRICRGPTIHRTRTRHPERKSKSEGHCGSYRANRERLWSQIPTSTQALLPTSTRRKCLILNDTFSGSVLLKTNLQWTKDCLARKSKGAVAGSNSTESKVFDHDRREGVCGSSINTKGNCASRKLIASGTSP